MLAVKEVIENDLKNGMADSFFKVERKRRIEVKLTY